MALGLGFLFTNAAFAQEADNLPDRVIARYSGYQNIEVSGTLELSLVENGKPQSHRSEFKSWFNSDGFWHEMSNQPLLARNKDKAYVYFPDKNVFMANDVAEGRLVYEKLPSSQKQILQEQNPLLALAISEDPKTLLTSLLGKEIKTQGAVMTGAVKRGDLELSAALEVDPQTLVMKRYEIDLTPYMAKNGRPDLSNVKLAVTYNPPTVDSKKNFTVFTPPGDARRVESSTLLATGKPAPDFTLQDLKGEKVTLSRLKGRVVILDFWATWCGPCRAAMPELNRLYDVFKEKDVIILACNQQEDKETVEKFMKENKLNFRALLDSERKAAEQYNVEGIPTTILIDQKGLVRSTDVGFPGTLDELEKKVNELLKGE